MRIRHQRVVASVIGAQERTRDLLSVVVGSPTFLQKSSKIGASLAVGVHDVLPQGEFWFSDHLYIIR